jgi:hypothetical protein
MLRFTLTSWAKLLLISLIIWPLSASAKSSAKKEPVDLSILQQSDALAPFMTSAQRIDYLKLDGALEAAGSNLRSGQHLVATKPSSFDPNRDVKPIIQRGERLIESALISMDTAQREMVALLTTVEGQKTAQINVDKMKYDFTLEAATLQEALATQCQQLLAACWDLGYETLFFDGVFIADEAGTQRAAAEFRNTFYDALVKIDGNTFSVTLPIAFQLKPDTIGQGRQIFSYENAHIFKDDKKALLAIELTLPQGSSSGLLSLRAIDLETQEIAAKRLVKITDLAQILGRAGEGSQGAELEDRIPAQVALRNQANTLERLSTLNSPYTFNVADGSDSTDGKVAATLLTHTLLGNSTLQLTDSDFIRRAYGESLNMPDTWIGQANAHLTLTETEETGSYQLSAQADGSERILQGGTFNLSYLD